MVRDMPPVRNLTPGHTVIHPNRDKAESKGMRAIVVFLLLVSVVLMLIVTVGGWSKLQGMKPLNFGWCLVYLILAVYVGRWSRGALPIASALAIILLIVSLIAGLGVSGTSWFDRNHAGFAHADSLFGGSGLGADTIGLVTLLIAPVQALLILFAMRGFSQGWNVEQEVPLEAERRGGTTTPPAPAAA
jgi:hypothetical protein